ncbi:MAG: nitrous oxide reductase family maturation protein NosD [Rhodothermia bacterium]|nr:nitrous oxide reductase family maturation protein NosD [Rhodothermia bacterium]
MKTRIFLAIAGIILTAAPSAFQVTARTIVVGPEGDVRSIQEAVALAQDGDSILVSAGVYHEPTIEIDRSLVLHGQPGAILDGDTERGLLLVTAPDVSITGFVFRNVGVSFVEDRAAIKVDAGHNCYISDNRFEDTFFAVYLAKTSGCTVARNTIIGRAERQTAAGNGIHAWYSRDLKILDNVIRHQRDGIYLEFVEDATIERNESVDNLRYGLHFMFSDRCRYVDNLFQYNDAGVAVMYTERVEMIGNRFEHNWGSASYGLLLKDIDDSRIVGNVFLDNTIGIMAEGANRMEVADNDFEANGWAVKIMANAIDNIFSRNNFVGNTFDVSTNSSRAYSSFEGNFWDRYQGYDLDRDGVGDVPFRPVRFFSLVVEREEPALILLRSFLVDLLDTLERVLPVLTPESLVDQQPRMRRVERTTPRHQS